MRKLVALGGLESKAAGGNDQSHFQGEVPNAEKYETPGPLAGRAHGYNLIPYLKGEAGESPRKEFLYWGDDGNLISLRYNQWKVVFAEQRAHGGIEVWQEPYVNLRVPKLFNLRSDPFERAGESFDYAHWRADRLFALVPAQAFVGRWLSSFKEFPPRQKAASFSIDQVMQKLQEAGGGNK
jgi:hypothetical protein